MGNYRKLAESLAYQFSFGYDFDYGWIESLLICREPAALVSRISGMVRNNDCDFLYWISTCQFPGWLMRSVPKNLAQGFASTRVSIKTGPWETNIYSLSTLEVMLGQVKASRPCPREQGCLVSLAQFQKWLFRSTGHNPSNNHWVSDPEINYH